MIAYNPKALSDTKRLIVWVSNFSIALQAEQRTNNEGE